MATRKFQLPVNGFYSGLNLEASVLNVLPSEFMDGTINVELLQNGSVRRRRGIDFIGADSSGSFMHLIRDDSPTANESSAESPSAVFVRLTAPDGSLVERIVVDLDNTWYVYKVKKENLVDFSNPLQTVARTGLAHDQQKFHAMSFAQSGKRVFFAGHHINPGYFEVDSDNESLIFVYYDVVIRDPDATEINTRVTRTIGGVARWFECIEAHTSDATNRPGDGTGDWQRYWAEKFAANPGSLSAWAGSTSYTTQMIKRYNTNSAPTSESDTYPGAVEFFAGRIWLSGDPAFPNEIMFTQVIQNDSHINRFYQEADPFDADDPNLVDADGGVIKQQGAGLVWQLLATGGSIFIGTNTGIFQIAGPDGIFKATNFAQNFILEERINGPYNMTKVDQEFIIFGETSIWLSRIEKSIAVTSTGQPAFINLSEAKIAQYYSNIPRSQKAAATTVYNSRDRKLYYFYNETVPEFSRKFGSHGEYNFPIYYTRCLVMDFRFSNTEETFQQREDQQLNRRVKGAFYIYSFNDGGTNEEPYIAFPFLSLTTPGIDEYVVDSNNDLVVDSTGDPVLASGASTRNKDAVLFVTMQRISSASGTTDIYAGFGRLEGQFHQDFPSDSNAMQSFTSKVVFGATTGGNIRHRKGGLYLNLLFVQTESHVLFANNTDITQGGANLRVATQWANSSQSPYYQSATAVYFPGRFGLTRNTGAEEGHDHVWFQRRIRGIGDSMQFILENDEDKPFHLAGWNWQFWGKND